MTEPAYLPMREAAARLGVSVDTVKRRIRRGELAARHEPRPQGSRLLVALPADVGELPPAPAATLPAEPAPPALGELVAQLTAALDDARTRRTEDLATLHTLIAAQERQAGEQLATLRAELGAELEARRREVSELHVLLQRAHEQLAPPHVLPAQLAAPPEQGSAGPAAPSPASSPTPPRPPWWRRLLGG